MSTSDDRTDGSLTTREKKVVQQALERGYFETPRRTTLVELSEILEIPDAEISQLLRSGIATVLKQNGVAKIEAEQDD